jgi:hypothetical protein
MKEVLDLVVKDRDTPEDIDHELSEYNSTSQETNLELDKIYCHRSKTYEHAINIMGDAIYEVMIKSSYQEISLKRANT